MEYSINTNYFEIISGTKNTLNPVYKEAADNAEKGNKNGMGYLKNFLVSIENVVDKEGVKDANITSSKGNIKNYKGYENIKTSIEFLSKHLGKVGTVKECIDIYDALEKYAPQYTEAYDKKVRLIVLEYESAVYMLVSGLSMIMATQVDFVANGTEIKIQKKQTATYGITEKTLDELAKQLSKREHKAYLEALLKAVDYQEPVKPDDVKPVKEDASEVFKIAVAGVADTLGLIKTVFTRGGELVKSGLGAFSTIKKTIFGIVPLIRSIVYLKWKRKADHVLALDQQCEFIKQNIEILQKNQTIDPEKKEKIIKKQLAVCDRYAKKAEKLRAQFAEEEKDAAVAIAKEDPKMKEVGEGELVLEAGMTVKDVFSGNE